MALPRQFLRQASRALAGPTQRRLRIAARHRFDQRLQRRQQRRSRSATSGRRPPPGRRTRVGLCRALRDRLVQFPQPSRNRRARQSGSMGHQRHSTPAQVSRLGRRPLPPPPLVHLGEQRLVLPSDPCDRLCVLHALSSRIPTKLPRSICKGYFCASPKLSSARQIKAKNGDPPGASGTMERHAFVARLSRGDFAFHSHRVIRR